MMERNDLYKALLDDLKARTGWEERQRIWYEMRHSGLRRKKKLPWQADLHYPLADSIINKLKPFYYQQVFSNEVIASFVPSTPQTDGITQGISRWFDYCIKQESNFESEILTAIDHTLMSGLNLLKISWDEDTKAVRFDSVDPVFAIVPHYTRDVKNCDRLCHVIQMSLHQYKANKLYNQDEELIRKIKGRTGEGTRLSTLENTKFRREGITVGAEEDQVIVWEVYERDEEGKIIVHTFSPLAPEDDIRPSFELPYKHGQMPFVPFVMEIKDKGVYSSRGLCEIVAPFESYMCKLMNEKADAMTLYNRPLFRCEQDIPNSNNLKFGPATILPVGVTPVTMPQPPISFDQEMINQRMISEYLTSMPDFGMGQQQGMKNARTATEISQIGALMGQSTDLRARIFRISLGYVYRQAYSVLCQFGKKSLSYYFNQAFGTVPPEALEVEYAIHPSGSADGINKAVQYQKAFSRMQLLSGNPFVDQPSLVRSVLEIDDPALVNKLLTDPNLRGQDEKEEQAKENLIMESGYPVTVKPQDDHKAHIEVLLGRIQLLTQQGGGSQQSQQLYGQHLEGHLQGLGKTDKNAERQIRGMLRKQAQAMQGQMDAQAQPQQGVTSTQTMPQGGVL
jgi:hypothetical protein